MTTCKNVITAKAIINETVLEIAGLYEDEPFETHIKVIAQEKYTRYPVFGEDKDEIIGMVNV
ncbi:hypothetical protein ACT4UL_28480, partial [Bacillus sp. HC-TM]